MRNKFITRCCLSAAVFAILCNNSFAAPVLEEVLVTATKREVGLQDVPIALSVMGANKIVEQGISTLEDMAVFMPNVHIAEGGAGDALFIRGVGSGINYGFEQSVGTFVDGIYFGRGQASRSSFLDVARVEVLKGSQSTLFGKNTIAGAINITSKTPGEEFAFNIDASYVPEFEKYSLGLAATLPISESFAVRLVGRQSQTKGYMDNTFTNERERRGEDKVARIVTRWDIADNITSIFKYENGKATTIGRQDILSIATPESTAIYREADPNFTASFGYKKSSINLGDPRPESQFHDAQWDIYTLTNSVEIGVHSLKSVTGYVNYAFQNYLDADYTALRFAARGRDEVHKQLSQEFIFSSPSSDTFEYMTGVYYQVEDLSHNRITDVRLQEIGLGVDTDQANALAGIVPVTNGVIGEDGGLDATGIATLQQDSETYSAFAQITWHMGSAMRVIAGLRYSYDYKEFEKITYAADLYTDTPNNTKGGIYDQVLDFSTDGGFGDFGAYRCTGITYDCETFPGFDNTREETHVTGDITYQVDFSDDIMAYTKFGTGYKAGGFDEANGRSRFDVAEYDDENVISFELGSKLELFDNRMRLNIALFYSDFDNVQVSTFDGNAGFVVGNAAKSNTQGIEIDGSAALTEKLTLNFGVAHLNARYDDYADAGCNEPQIIAHIDNGGTRSSCKQDLSGKRLQFAPEWSASMALAYATPIGEDLEFTASADFLYSTEVIIATDQDEVLNQKTYYKVNVRVGLNNTQSNWSAAILGKNLTDEATTTWGNDVPLASLGFSETYFQHIDAPRSFELQLNYKY